MRLPRIAPWAAALLAVLALLDVAVFAAHAAGLRVNATASMPLGLYRIAPADTRALSRGTLVAICPSDAALAVALPRGYLRPGSCPGGVEPFLKRIAAVASDVVEVSDGGVRVDGVALPESRRLPSDCQGRPLPRIPAGRYALAAGALWLYAPTAHSWDSRYFGAEPARNVVGVATPLVIVGTGNPCG